MKNFHFKTRNTRIVETFKSIVENFESTNIFLKNITTISFCFVDTNEKIFVENFELIEIIIDIETNNFVEIDVIFKKNRK